MVKRRFVVLFIAALVILIITSREGYAQVDSRNQVVPQKEKKAQDPDKKRIKSKRVKSKKDPRLKGKKLYSNKKQLKRNRRAKAKRVDKSPKGDITGRKISTKRTPRRTYARPQEDPYKNRRIRTERSRAGPDAPEVRTATKKGERARTGDISGQKRVRQRSVRTAPSIPYPQPNPYVGRKIRTEKVRAKSNTKQINSIRSATKPSESRPPKSKTIRAASGTAAPSVKRKRNVYRNHERTGGERSTDKDIAGRKIRTKNTRSAILITGGKDFGSGNSYAGSSPQQEGSRVKRSRSLPASARSISRSSESGSAKNYDRYGRHRNRKSVRFTGVVAAKRIRTSSDPQRKGEQPIYGKKYSPRSVRSVSGYSQARGYRGGGAPVSISGRRKQYKQRNTYQGKDRHFGENSSTKDIAGRRLRTRNYRSFNPTWSEFGQGLYGSGSASRPSKKYANVGGRSQTKSGWNNGGIPIFGRSPGNKGTSTYTGSLPIGAMPNYGPSRAGTYSGKYKSKSLRKYSGGNESLYAGNRKSYKRLQGGGSITGGWNNNGQPIFGRGRGFNGAAISGFSGRRSLSSMPNYGPGKSSSYSGRIPSKNLRKYSGGNESLYSGGIPAKKLRKYSGGNESLYSGRIPAKNLRRYSGGNESLYAGGLKARKPFLGGGSITKGWNNNGEPIVGSGRTTRSLAGSGFTGRRPLSSMPSYGPSKSGSYSGNMKAKNLRKYYGGTESLYAGRMKARKPLKGGGSITGLWNNNGQPIQGGGNTNSLPASNFKGNMRLSAMPSYGKGREGSYAGNMKGRKPLKGAGGSITGLWNNNGQPLPGKGRNANNEAAANYKGRMPLSAMPSYGNGKEGSYAGNMKAKKPLKGGGGSITRHWNNNGNPLPQSELGKSDDEMGSYQGTFKSQPKIAKSPGTERGRTRSFTFLRIGDPNHGGLTHEENKLKYKKDLPSELSRAEKQRIKDSPGVRNGRTRSLSFMKIGNPTQGGLHEEVNNYQWKSDLPRELKRNNRLRLAEAEGMDNGRNRSFSFWAIGDPTHGGLVRNPAQAKGRLHPSADYTKPGKSRNALEEKEQPIKIKIWWAKLFKKNSNQPDAVKEKERKPRYDKNERLIWETSEREDWYDN